MHKRASTRNTEINISYDISVDNPPEGVGNSQNILFANTTEEAYEKYETLRGQYPRHNISIRETTETKSYRSLSPIHLKRLASKKPSQMIFMKDKKFRTPPSHDPPQYRDLGAIDFRAMASDHARQYAVSRREAYQCMRVLRSLVHDVIEAGGGEFPLYYFDGWNGTRTPHNLVLRKVGRQIHRFEKY